MKKLFVIFFLLIISFLSSCGERKNNESDDNVTSLDIENPIPTSEPIQQQPKKQFDYHGIKPASIDTMLVVVNRQGELIGRFVSSTASTYTVAIQDHIEIPKIGNKVVTFRAADGQGILFNYRTNVNIRQRPDINSPVICQISHDPKEDLSDPYPCLGKTDEWYKIKVGNKVGYVRHDLVEWDAMDTQ